jgi:hypothetical protein
MKGLNQASARFTILMVAAGYIVLFGLIEGARQFGWTDSIEAAELLQKATTLASLTVGAVIGFHLASRQSQS